MLFANRKPKNRRKQGEPRWRLPAIDWRRVAMSMASLAILGAGVAVETVVTGSTMRATSRATPAASIAW